MHTCHSEAGTSKGLSASQALSPGIGHVSCCTWVTGRSLGRPCITISSSETSRQCGARTGSLNPRCATHKTTANVLPKGAAPPPYTLIAAAVTAHTQPRHTNVASHRKSMATVSIPLQHANSQRPFCALHTQQLGT